MSSSVSHDLGPALDFDAALAKVRPAVEIGGRYLFFSTMQGADASGLYPCLYSAHECVVVSEVQPDDEDAEQERVRFGNGDELDVFVGEIDGFMFDTGQWHGPFAVERSALEPVEGVS